MLRNQRHTSARFGLFLQSPAPIPSHQNSDLLGSISEWLGNSGDLWAVLGSEMVGRSDEGTARLLAELFVTLLVIVVAIGEFLLTYN
jgi:hypothetical protein